MGYQEESLNLLDQLRSEKLQTIP